MRRSICAMLGLAAAIMAPVSMACAQDAAPVSLAYGPEPGDAWRNIQSIEVRDEAWLGPYDDRSNLLRSMRTSKSVQNVTEVVRREPDGSTTTATRPESMEQEVVTFSPREGETRTYFNSELPADQQLPEYQEFIAAFRNIRATMTFDPEGNLVAYRVEPEGDPLVDTLALASSQRANGMALKYPPYRISPGDTWQFGRATLEATVMGLGNGHIEYPVEATLVSVEEAYGRTHALIRATNGEAVHVRDNENAGPGLSEFRFEALFEIDLERARQVDAKATVVLQLFALDEEAGDILNLEEFAVVRERDVDSVSWMIGD